MRWDSIFCVESNAGKVASLDTIFLDNRCMCGFLRIAVITIAVPSAHSSRDWFGWGLFWFGWGCFTNFELCENGDLLTSYFVNCSAP